LPWNPGTNAIVRTLLISGTTTLSGQLDISTLRVGAASHPYRFSVTGKGKPMLTFTVDDINLPDSTRDQAGSNGFIRFSIRPQAGLADKARIENFADIFFDYNDPVRTNTVFNTLRDVPAIVAPQAGVDAASVIFSPAITGFIPGSGPAGTLVNITGINFDPAADNNSVAFNRIKATVTETSATRLSVTVPRGDATGKITETTPYGTAVSATDFTLTTAAGELRAEFMEPTRLVTEIVLVNALGEPALVKPLTGKLVRQTVIDVSGYGNGRFLVLIRTTQGVITRKVVVQRATPQK
jgi:hypothetical protein